MHEIIRLPNGVRLICEHMPHVRSAALGIFVNVGSRDELASQGGSAHFIEHMLFKSTKQRSTEALAFAMDAIGGQVNAYTTRESTCFYARVLDTHLHTAIELLTEMFFEPAFNEEETASERGVILEEIGMYDDAPDDACYEKLMSGCFKGSLGRPVLGRPRSLEAMTGEGLKAFKDSHYTADRLVISLCGSYDESHISRLAERFSALPKTRKRKRSKAEYQAHVTVRRKKTEQNHFCMAFPSSGVDSEDRFGLSLMATILGGGVSSRLFQNIREKHGLCYSIYAFQSTFSGAGLISLATAVSKDTEMRTLTLIGEELRRFLEDGVTEDELDRAREQAKSSLVMGLESTNSRMLKMGGSLSALGVCLTADELIARYDAVSREDILRLARSRFDFNSFSLSAYGKTEGEEAYLSALAL